MKRSLLWMSITGALIGCAGIVGNCQAETVRSPGDDSQGQIVYVPPGRRRKSARSPVLKDERMVAR